MRRKNFKSALIVERAIRLAAKGKAKDASQLCAENSIPLDVAHRVITKPKQRRDYRIKK